MELKNMEIVINIMKIVVSLGVMGFLGLGVRLYNAIVAKPNRLRSMLLKQGINGPPPALLLGNLREIKKAINSAAAATTTTTVTAAKALPTHEPPPATHNCGAALFPFFEQWRRQYGETFVFSLGNIPIVYTNKAGVVKEISTCTSLDLGKPSYQHKERGPLLGQGILTSNGAAWVHQRKILAPHLYVDKVKGMVNLISESATTLVNSWKSTIETDGNGLMAEINIDDGMRSFSGDVISRACFGSNYARGEQIFLKLRALQDAMSKKGLSAGIPGIRYLPTKSNREAWALEKEVRNLILEVAKERQRGGAACQEKDLLQMVVEGAESDSNLPNKEAMQRFIVDNCKNIYLAGYETTAVASSWCLMLLAANQDWQDRARTEVLEIFGEGSRVLDNDMLRKMKLLTMVIHESLRLYPPVAVVSREAFMEMKFGDMTVPKGVNVWTMVTTLHTDPEIWGPDSYNFNPERFKNGIAGACKLPYLYMPFGVGPRVCLGQNLAMAELKILLALILSNFSFSLSPNYIHSPALRLVVEPKHGVTLVLKKL